MPPVAAPLDYRFWQKVSPEPNSGCWLWTGPYMTNGYGALPYRDAYRLSAHRFSYEMHFGPIPKGMSVCHRCDVPACVNPDHLFLGTQRDNIRDCKAKGRQRGTFAPRERCRCGEPYKVTVYARGATPGRAVKYCRQCTRKRGQLNYLKRKARKGKI